MQAVRHFLGGLKEEVELSVRLFRPTTLQDAYGLARVQDLLWNTKTSITNQTQTKQPKTYSNSYTPYTPVTKKTSANPHQLLDLIKRAPLLPTPTTYNKKPTKTLTSKDMDEKRSKGLCFWCDEKFVPSHKCPRK